MALLKLIEPIIIEKSTADSRSLIMPHQQETVDAMTAYFTPEKDIPNRNGMVVMPTGSGKTYTAVNWLLSQGIPKGYRVLWLVHRQELVEQTFQEFRKQAPLLKGTSVKKLRIYPVSGMHLPMSSACGADIYVCSIASVANKYGYRFIERMIGAAGKRRLIVVIDEAHHSVASSYQKVLKRITKLNPNRILLGLTATPKRMQESEQKRLQEIFSINKNLIEEKGIHGYVYEVTLKHLLMSGFLAQPFYEPVNTEIIGEVTYAATAEDEEFFLKFGELSERLKTQISRSSSRNQMILKQYLEHKERYGKTIIFAVNQMHAETLCNEFKKAGISCNYAVSDRADAQDVIRRFKANEFQVLINVQILTEGSDVPDVQTVFLTRETNSDSLLMQMIGRGLRGEKAGGTKTAYIVAFHDTWKTFAHWMDPGTLDIFVTDEEEDSLPEDKTETVEISPNEEMLKLLDQLAAEGQQTEKNIETAVTPLGKQFSVHDLYMKLYESMRVSLTRSESVPIFPCGWYSVMDEDGNDHPMLVYDCQLEGYTLLARNLKLLHTAASTEVIQRIYFTGTDVKPDEEDLAMLLDYIIEMDEMPPYFTFQQREAFDPKSLADKLGKMFEKDSEKEAWLKQLYDASPVLKQIYKSFFAFKKTVNDAAKAKSDAIIQSEDDRAEYNIIPDYYNLSELLEEVLLMFPKLRTDGLVKLAWSDRINTRWFGLCHWQIINGKAYYQIYINRLLSSPDVDKEVIKYLIFHELLHENGYWPHDEEFRKREWQYPNSAELDGFLDSLSFKYKMENIYANAAYTESSDSDIKNRDVSEEQGSLGQNKHLSVSEESGKDTGASKDSSISETHEDITEEDTNEPVPPAPVFNPNAKGVKPGIKYCRNCGNKLPVSARFCDKCGERIEY